MTADARCTMRARAVIVALALAALAAGGGGGGKAPARGSPVPVVVDTDMSTDDVVALLYLLGRRDVDVRAVAVSGTGLVRCPAGARHARELLALAGRGDVPVGCGRADPIEGFDAFPPDWRDRADAFFGLELPRVRSGPADPAVDVLRQAIETAPRPVTLLSLAPLTDTAQLLDDRPARLGAIVAMGGALDVPGNIGPGHEHAEYNLWIDPVAASRVLRSGVPVTLVPLDATNQAPVTLFPWEALKRSHYATPRATAVYDLMNATGMHSGGQYFWDPLAATAIGADAPLRYAHARVDVVTRGGDRGRLVRSAGGGRARVATGADRRRFERLLLGSLLGGARFEIPADREPPALEFDGRTVTYRGPRIGPAGEISFTTVNSGDRPFTFVVGRLSEGRTAGDLRGGRGPFQPPGWFSPELIGETPPHSTMTWLRTLTPGEKAIVVTAPAQSWVVSPLRVTPR
jgi:inosine-uridine nucleoside N-ribohydrolase